MEIQGRARVKESLTPIIIFLVGIVLLGFTTGFIDKAYYQKHADVPPPVVKAESRKLVDECGVFMSVQWDVPRDPTIDKEAPYISMKERIKQKSAARKRLLP